jgi:hypothetical protein
MAPWIRTEHPWEKAQGMRMLSGGHALASGLAFSDLSLPEFWAHYLQLSGIHTQPDLYAYLKGVTQWSTAEHDVAAQALTEYFADRGLHYPVAHADEI